MNDLKPFKHGEEGTHYVCQEVLELKGGKATCCGCSGHKCKKPKPMKRIKKECKNCKSEAGKWIAVEYRKNGDAICSVCGKIVSKCLNPKPQEKCHCCEWKSPDHLQEDGSCNHCPHHCSPKPTKIEKLEELEKRVAELEKKLVGVHNEVVGGKIDQERKERQESYKKFRNS